MLAAVGCWQQSCSVGAKRVQHNPSPEHASIEPSSQAATARRASGIGYFPWIDQT